MSGSIEKTISGFALPDYVLNAIEYPENILDSSKYISLDNDGAIFSWAQRPFFEEDEWLPENFEKDKWEFLGNSSMRNIAGLWEKDGLSITSTQTGESSNAPTPCYVKWIDAVHCDGQGWKELDQFEPVPAECYSVGFIVHEDDSILVLAATVDMHEGFFTHYCSEISIPKVCILERKEL